MGNHQVPRLLQQRPHVALDVRTGPLRRQQVAGDGVMAALNERVPDDAAELARYQHSHSVTAMPVAGWSSRSDSRALVKPT